MTRPFFLRLLHSCCVSVRLCTSRWASLMTQSDCAFHCPRHCAFLQRSYFHPSLQEAINSPIAIESLKSRVQLLRLLVQRAERAGELTALWTNTRSVAVTKPRVALSSSKKKAAARSAAAAAAAAPIAAKKSIVDTALEHAQVIVDKARVFSSPSILGNLGSLLAQLSGPISGDHRGAKAIQECASVSLRHAICSHVLRSKIPAPLCVPSSVAAPATASTKDICAALEQLSLNSEVTIFNISLTYLEHLLLG